MLINTNTLQVHAEDVARAIQALCGKRFKLVMEFDHSGTHTARKPGALEAEPDE
jgi:hypothetical protein